MWALVAAAMLFVAAAVLFTKLTLKPSSPSRNPFESDARKPRKEYVIDQKERDAVIKQNYNIDKVSKAREVFPILSFVIGVQTPSLTSKQKFCSGPA